MNLTYIIPIKYTVIRNARKSTLFTDTRFEWGVHPYVVSYSVLHYIDHIRNNHINERKLIILFFFIRTSKKSLASNVLSFLGFQPHLMFLNFCPKPASMFLTIHNLERRYLFLPLTILKICYISCTQYSFFNYAIYSFKLNKNLSFSVRFGYGYICA